MTNYPVFIALSEHQMKQNLYLLFLYAFLFQALFGSDKLTFPQVEVEKYFTPALNTSLILFIYLLKCLYMCK